jgi:hypothetical protein
MVLEQGQRLLLDRTQHWSGIQSIFPWRRCSGEVDVERERRASAVRSTAAGAIGHANGRPLQLVKGRGGVGWGDNMAAVSGRLDLLFMFCDGSVMEIS